MDLPAYGLALGTGWTVDDAQALSFAEEFYPELLRNERLGDAVTRARNSLFAMPGGSTWGAYQFYGDPDARLLPRAANDDTREAPRRNGARANVPCRATVPARAVRRSKREGRA